ncbi:protein SIX6OS1 [Centropristis striata]|uniref:protein SIX6OS1 n=1 Tax=Centropristis striata TaxID=184440 RepID=UPI0027E0AC35|nr:protein SIX6OS1 [Centropristis striata]
MEEAAEDEVEERAALEEEQAPSQKDDEVQAAFVQPSSPEMNPPSCRAETAAVPSTPTFPFSFSPTTSPHPGTSDTKSPAFVFNLNPGPSTPGFSGFGFDVGLSQEEDSSFAFTSPFFNEKKPTESKSSTCPEFLFGQPEQSEDFQFAFNAKSPQTTNKDTTRDDFPFTFNF